MPHAARRGLRAARYPLLLAVMTIAGLVSLSSTGCSGSSGRTIRTEPEGFTRTVEPIRRGTLSAIASTTAGDPILLSGYGLVVGLDGTGGGVLAEDVVATMERQMQLQGIGRGSGYTVGPMVDPATGLPKTARQLLSDPNVAVVLVQAVIARGSPEGLRFDVVVRALNATSLRGGTLWSTDMRLGPPASFGRIQTRKVSEAYGPIYTNPFLEPDSEAAANQPVGRVLSGGVVTDPLAVQIALDTPSHVRATQIVSAVNSRFRAGRFDPGPIARGRSDSLVDILIPDAWRTNPGEFVQLLEFVQLDYQFPAENARRIVNQMRRDRGTLEIGSTMLVAIGDPALPMARDLYDEESPALRLAGLSAGARLGDELAEEGLLEFAEHSRGSEQRQALNMLGRIDGGIRSQQLLQTLAGTGPVTVRIAAYAAIAERAERLTVRSQPGNAYAREQAELRLVHRGIGGFERRAIGGDSFDQAARRPRFVLDRVPWGDPLVFVTQQGRPRIVLMGRDLQVRRPAFVSLWGGRWVMVADGSSDPLRISYREGDAVVPYTVGEAPTRLDELVMVLARVRTQGDPRPGFGLSYGEVVSVLSGLGEQRGSAWAFTTQEDTLTAAIAEARSGPASRARPDTTADIPDEEDVGVPGVQPTEPRRPEVVPLGQPVGQPADAGVGG